MSDWWQYDGRDDDNTPAPARMELFDDVDALPSELVAHETNAMQAIRAIADFGESHPNKRLVVSATLRKLETVAGSRTQSLGLRSVTVRKERR